MIRKNIMIKPMHDDALRKEAAKHQVSVSELLRNILDKYFPEVK
jgi:hypothetical protein